MLVDTSQSLKDTDPGAVPARVQALKGAVLALDTVADDRPVFVEFVDFGSIAERSFPDLAPWSEVQGSPDDLIRRVEAFATRNNSEDTDYAAALQRAGEAISGAPTNSCRLVTWFTDGELDIDFQGTAKTLTWVDPPVEVRSESDEIPAELRATEEICRPGGLADQLRGTTGSVEGDGVFLAAVAFGDPDRFEFLERIATNSTGDCGERPALGTIVLTEDLDTLTTGLIRGVDPAPEGATSDPIPAIDDERCSQPLDPGNPGAFTIPSSVAEVRMRTETPGRDVVPVLLTPGSVGQPAERIALNTSNSATVADGAQLVTAVLSPRLTSLSLKFPDQIGGWVGDWELRFCSTDGSQVGANGTVEVLAVAGTVEADLVEGTTLRRDRKGEAVVQLRSEAGFARSSDAIGLGDYSVSIVGDDDVAVQFALEPDDGSIRVGVDVPADFEPDDVVLAATLSPVVEVFPPGRDWVLTPWEGQLPSIAVFDLPNYPLVDPPSAFGVLDQEHLTSDAELLIQAVGPESAGCVTLVNATISGPEDAPHNYSIRVFDGEREIQPGDQCAVELSSDAQVALTVTASLDSDAARLDSKLAGIMTLQSVSKADPSQLEEFTYPFTVRVDPLLIVENPESEVVLALLLLAIAAPLLLLYLYNFVWGARFDVVSSQTVTIPVVLSRGRLMRVSESGDTEPLAVDPADLRPWPQAAGRYRRVGIKTQSGDSVELRARISPFPWGAPRGTANVSEAPIQVGALGSERRFGRARTPLTTSRMWLFGSHQIVEEPRTDSEPSAADSSTRVCTGTLVILPGRGDELELAREILNDAAESLETTLLGDDVPVSHLVGISDDEVELSKETEHSSDWEADAGRGAQADDDWDRTGPDASLKPRSPVADDDLPY